jgi:hypothetical protein
LNRSDEALAAQVHLVAAFSPPPILRQATRRAHRPADRAIFFATFLDRPAAPDFAC